MKFRKKQVEVEAITFDELVEHGKNNGANIVNGMPWSFKYQGHPITHENDECYLIPTLEGTMKFTPQDMLITGVNGEIYPCKKDIFAKTYDEAGDTKHSLPFMKKLEHDLLTDKYAEVLIALVITRLEHSQKSEFSCRENAVAITQLEEALLWLRKRTMGRERRGVEGTHTK